MQNKRLRNHILCAIFTALIAIGAFIRVPVPVVPFTLSFLFTTLAGLLLGPRLGALSVAIYVVLGLMGVPVFVEGGGPGYILKPSFGYLIGFALGAYVSGWFARKEVRPTFKTLFIGNFLNLMVVYGCGMVYVYFISSVYLGKPIGLWPLFLYCFLLAVPGDAVLCVLAAMLGTRLIPLIGINRKKREDMTEEERLAEDRGALEDSGVVACREGGPES